MKLFLASLALIASTSAFAAPAVFYKCVGTDALTQGSVSFDLLFSDSFRDQGYQNESITITQKGWEDFDVKDQTVFQLHGVKPENNCTKVDGQIMLKTEIDMTPSNEMNGYIVTVKSTCPGAELDAKAICIFQ